MLKITVPANEYYDELKNEFISTKEQTLVLEHSLVSISKWESKWEEPFLVDKKKSPEQMADYIRCMTLTQNVDPNIYGSMTEKNIEDITNYINAKQTATTIKELPGQIRRGNEIITSEIIYYWMIALQIPVEFQKWHLNRLITLIRVCNIKNAPPKKMSRRETINSNRALNEARRKAHNTKG